MTAAAELYAVAAGIERQAATVEHSTWQRRGEAPPAHGRHEGCWRCHLEAKARLHARAAGCAEAVGA